MLKETTISGIFRDDSGALINKNNDALLSYKMKKENSRRLQMMENQVTELKSDMNEIKNLLIKLTTDIGKTNGN